MYSDFGTGNVSHAYTSDTPLLDSSINDARSRAQHVVAGSDHLIGSLLEMNQDAKEGRRCIEICIADVPSCITGRTRTVL